MYVNWEWAYMYLKGMCMHVLKGNVHACTLRKRVYMYFMGTCIHTCTLQEHAYNDTCTLREDAYNDTCTLREHAYITCTLRERASYIITCTGTLSVREPANMYFT